MKRGSEKKKAFRNTIKNIFCATQHLPGTVKDPPWGLGSESSLFQDFFPLLHCLSLDSELRVSFQNFFISPLFCLRLLIMHGLGK